MGKMQVQPDYSNNAAFEQIWAILQETAKRQEETDKKAAKWQEKAAKWREEADKRQEEAAKRQEETDKKAAKRREEADKKAAKWREEIDKKAAKWREEIDKKAAKWNEEAVERHKELDRIVKENAKLIGGLGGRYGEMIEYMVKPNLVNKFNELGFVFTKVYPDTVIKDEKNKILAQIDMTLENGDKVMIVEVKSKPSIEDIKDHVERMGKVRRHADLHNDKRKYLGAVAGMVVNDKERDFILKNGFYAVEPSGETFTITSPAAGKVREW